MLLDLHLVSTLLMVGIIWFVQIVHYPLMIYVGQDRFREYSDTNRARTTWVVGGPMLIEALTAAALIAWYPERLLSRPFLASIFLLLLIWISTAVWQIPLHARLALGFNPQAIRQLARSNWLRTIAWSVRAVLVGMTVLSPAPFAS